MEIFRVKMTVCYGFLTAFVSVPTLDAYIDEGVFDSIVDAIEEIGYSELECESEKKVDIRGTTFDQIRVKFKALNDLTRFSAYIHEKYE